MFNRSRNRTVNYIVSKLPTNRTVSLRRLRTFVAEHTPNKGLTAGHGRPSVPGLLSKVGSNGAANTPLYTVVRGASAHSNSCTFKSAPQPSPTSCATGVHCNSDISVQNSKRFSNELATPLYVTKNVYGRLLTEGNVFVNTRLRSMNEFVSRSFPLCPSGRLFSKVTTGTVPTVDSSSTRLFTSRVRTTQVSLSSINNYVRATVVNIPTNVKDPVFRNIRGELTRTVFKVPTIGKLRFNVNFTSTQLGNSRGGSPCYVISNRIEARAGGSNKVVNNVAGNVPVAFETTVGPAASVKVARRAIELSAVRRTTIRVGNERSPYMTLHTIPIFRTITTTMVLSVCLRTGACKLG